MDDKLTAEVSVTIDNSINEVWTALITPEIIKKYLMGTNVTTDWKPGSPITYDGEYEGKKYHDKGVIKEFEPGRLLQTTYWSSMSGKEDRPENYNVVTYLLFARDGKTVVTLTQDNVATEDEWVHATKNWEAVLNKLKEVVEAGV